MFIHVHVQHVCWILILFICSDFSNGSPREGIVCIELCHVGPWRHCYTRWVKSKNKKEKDITSIWQMLKTRDIRICMIKVYVPTWVKLQTWNHWEYSYSPWMDASSSQFTAPLHPPKLFVMLLCTAGTCSSLYWSYSPGWKEIQLHSLGVTIQVAQPRHLYSNLSLL